MNPLQILKQKLAEVRGKVQTFRARVNRLGQNRVRARNAAAIAAQSGNAEAKIIGKRLAALAVQGEEELAKVGPISNKVREFEQKAGALLSAGINLLPGGAAPPPANRASVVAPDLEHPRAQIRATQAAQDAHNAAQARIRELMARLRPFGEPCYRDAFGEIVYAGEEYDGNFGVAPLAIIAIAAVVIAGMAAFVKRESRLNALVDLEIKKLDAVADGLVPPDVLKPASTNPAFGFGAGLAGGLMPLLLVGAGLFVLPKLLKKR